ncbi:hypothetical protein ABZW49_15285 [Nonomuraea wenchangensis]
MDRNIPSGPCDRLAWCRIRHPTTETSREHISEKMDFSTPTHLLTLVCRQEEQGDAPPAEPSIRITYGPTISNLRPAWLDLALSEADYLAELLGQLAFHNPAGLNEALHTLSNACKGKEQNWHRQRTSA